MSELIIHDVKKVNIGKWDHKVWGGGSYKTKKIIITTDKGYDTITLIT